jgi:hypothetical protein
VAASTATARAVVSKTVSSIRHARTFGSVTHNYGSGGAGKTAQKTGEGAPATHPYGQRLPRLALVSAAHGPSAATVVAIRLLAACTTTTPQLKQDGYSATRRKGNKKMLLIDMSDVQ